MLQVPVVYKDIDCHDGMDIMDEVKRYNWEYQVAREHA